MALIEWQSVYEIGITEVDDQHKKLVEMINKLERSVNSRQAEAEAQEVLSDLVDYVRFHFASEERLMAENNYPHVDHHAQLHAQFIRKIASLLTQLKASGTINAPELLAFLKKWLIDHILREDTKLRVLSRPTALSR